MWLMGPAAPRHVRSSQTRARTRVPCTGRQILNNCATREVLCVCFLWFELFLPPLSPPPLPPPFPSPFFPSPSSSPSSSSSLLLLPPPQYFQYFYRFHIIKQNISPQDISTSFLPGGGGCSIRYTTFSEIILTFNDWPWLYM